MAEPDTRLIISIETILRNLDKTLRGISQLEKQLKSVANVRVNTNVFAKTTAAATSSGRAQVDQAHKTAREIERINAQTARNAERQEAIRVRAAKAIATVQTREARRGADAFIKSMKAQEVAAGATNARLQALGNSLRSLGQGAASVGFGLTAAISIPLVAIGKSSLDAAVTIDSLKRGLTAIVGSAEEASVQLQRLTQIAKLPGIGFEEAIQGSIRLQAVGFSAADAEKALIQFSNAVALTGGGREELARITVQLGQLAAKGKVLSQDLRPIIEAAPAVGRALKQAFGTVNADDIADLTTNSREFLDTLVKELERLPRAAAGARNTFENFRDEVFRASAAVGDALIPVLTRLISVAGPIITKLAEGFSKLPVPVQTAAVGMGALAVATGPALIGIGLLTTGVGRLGVGLAQLSALGMLPTIANLRAFNAAAAVTIARLLGLRAATVAAAGPWVLLATAIGAVAAAFLVYRSVEQSALAIDIKAAKARNDRMESTKDELKFLEGLTAQVAKTADEEKRLAASYASVSGEAKGRIALLDDETTKLQALIEAKKEQLRIDQFAAGATLVQLVNNLTLALEKQRKAQEELNDAKRSFAEGAARGRGRGEREDVFLDRVNVALLRQKNASLAAAAALEKLAETRTDVNAAATAILELSRVTGLSVNTILEQAKAAGADAAEIERVRKAIDEFAQSQADAVPEVKSLTDALKEQTRELLKAGDAANEMAKKRKSVVGAAVTLAQEASDSFEGAMKFMNSFIAAQPDLRAAIQKEAQLAGKSFEEFVRDSLAPAGRSGTSLRNAQEQLAKALAEISRASAAQLFSIEQDKNERLLQQNESNFKLQLIAYRQYLNERARLTSANLEQEIQAQSDVLTDALARQQRFLDRAEQAGIPAAERVKAKAGAAEAGEEVIKAQTKILELRAKQRLALDEVNQLLAEGQKQQINDIRQLEIEYAELTGRIEDALNAATDEKFRESLQALSLAQDDLNKRLLVAKEIKDADAIEELERARAINQRQIDVIENLIEQERATNRLTAANEFVTRAKERQSELEKQIALDVDLRGLSEDEAIRRRLEGEERLKRSLLISRDIVQQTIDRLQLLGATPPKGLLDFVRQVNLEVQSLGKLTFTEQFRLAEKEFSRIQDVLADKIADVERAVRSRTISEVEGRLIIRRLNGEYVGDLEKQLELLKQIAAQSNDESLKRQANAAEQSVKDTRAAADELKNFNTQLKSVAIDSFGDSLSQLFKDLRDNTESATQDILNFFNNILNRVNDFIAENLAQRITEALFPDPNAPKGSGGGILSTIKGLFGMGSEAGGAASLTTASVTLSTSITTAAAAFASIITAAGAAFAATVASAGFASSLSSGAAAGFAGGFGFAKGDIIPAAPSGRVIKVAEGGHAEAVITSDPRYAMKQAEILRRFLRMTKGLSGHFRGVPEMAAGGIISARDAEANLLASLPSRTSLASLVPTSLASRGDSAPNINFRNINLLDRREMVRGHMRSAEGAQDILNVISENADEIGRRIRVR